MRAIAFIALCVLPLGACMTQRDKTIWAEFKAEIASKPEVKADPIPSAALDSDED